MKTNILLCIGASLVCTAMAIAGDQGFVKEGSKRSISLPAPVFSMQEGPGMDTTSRYCSICHSLDYITTQQKFPKAKWQAEVTKMIKTYGAPISEENARIIVDYISTHYGTGG
jgi:sulfite dehydrogenase (cytochrome) subunit B